MPSDFNIQREVVQKTKITGNVTYANFNPATGSNAAVVYIEPKAGQGGAILALLSQIEALSENYGKKIWPATAQSNCKPQVEIRVIVKDDVPAEE